jgi:WD40 repeat protein
MANSPLPNSPALRQSTEKNLVVRVFVSSTFRDMHAERDHLVTVVFPELRERVERLGLEFFDVDLRWGVPAKGANGETANSWEYCKKWIDRVEPFFVSLLGQRYGFVPEPEQIRDEADREAFATLSITEMEIRHAVLAGRIRRRSFFYLRKTLVPDQSDAVNRTTFVEDEAKIERLKTLIKSGPHPVYEYPCRWTGAGFSDMEDFGRRVLDDLWSGVLRDERYVSKEIWRQVLGDDPDHDTCYTDESVPIPENIAAKIVALAKPLAKDPLDAEREQMKAFATSRLGWFQGRTRELQQLTDFINSNDKDAPRLAVVVAIPGQGKSALLAKLSESISTSSLVTHHSSFLITHFVGATERSSSAYALVERLLDELDRSGIAWSAEEQKEEGQEPKRDFNSLCVRLTQRLSDYAGERKIIILLDALNQLSDGQDLNWLPAKLGSGVRVIVSCIEDSTPKADSPKQCVLYALASRQPAPLRVSLGPLTEDDVRIIAVAYLQEYCHELDREQLDMLCAITQARNPLYLLVMLNELRTLGGNDLNSIVPRLISSMPQDHPDAVSLFRWVLQRLEVFGSEAVRWWCMYLAHGRVGMASHELADLLALKLGADAAAATALRIERGLRRYLQRRGPQLDFFHGQLRQAVVEKYTRTKNDRESVHNDLADYFMDRAGECEDPKWNRTDPRPFLELPWHLYHAGRDDELRSLLLDFEWLRSKLNATNVDELILDFNLVSASPVHSLIQSALVLSSHVVQHNPDLLSGQLIARLLGFHEQGIKTFLECVHPAGSAVWLKPAWSCLAGPSGPKVRTMAGHQSDVTCLAITPDGHFAVSGSTDKTVKVWNLAVGKEIRSLEGHKDQVSCIAITPDGSFAVSGSEDNTLKVWELAIGKEVRSLHGHTSRVSGVAITPDGRFVVSGSADSTSKVWELATGKEVRTLKGHKDRVSCIAITPDGRFVVSGSDDTTLKVWNLATGKEVRTFEGHKSGVSCVAITPDGCFAVSGADSNIIDNDEFFSASGTGSLVFDHNALKVWNLATGQEVRSLDGHDGLMFCIAITPDGRFAVTGCDDKTLKVWELATGKEVQSIEENPYDIYCVGITPDGHLAVSGSSDGTLQLWELACGKKFRSIDGHREKFGCIAITPNGHFAVSSGSPLQGWFKDKPLKVWELTTGKEVQSLQVGEMPVTCVGITPDGSFAVLGPMLKSIEVRELATGRLVQTLATDFTVMWTCLGITPDGRFVVSGSSENNILKVLEFATGKEIRFLEGHTGEVKCVAITPDGRFVVSGSADSTLKVWELAIGKEVRSLHGHTSQVLGVAITPDERFVVSGSADSTLKVWELTTGKEVRTLEGHESGVSCVAITPDGRFIVSGSYDTTLKVWNLATGQLLASFVFEADVVGCAATPDCKGIIVGAGNVVARLDLEGLPPR